MTPEEQINSQIEIAKSALKQAQQIANDNKVSFNFSYIVVDGEETPDSNTAWQSSSYEC